MAHVARSGRATQHASDRGPSTAGLLYLDCAGVIVHCGEQPAELQVQAVVGRQQPQRLLQEPVSAIPCYTYAYHTKQRRLFGEATRLGWPVEVRTRCTMTAACTPGSVRLHAVAFEPLSHARTNGANTSARQRMRCGCECTTTTARRVGRSLLACTQTLPRHTKHRSAATHTSGKSRLGCGWSRAFT